MHTKGDWAMLLEIARERAEHAMLQCCAAARRHGRSSYHYAKAYSMWTQACLDQQMMQEDYFRIRNIRVNSTGVLVL